MTMYHHDSRPMTQAVADAATYLQESVRRDAARAAAGFKRLQERVITDTLVPLADCTYQLASNNSLLVNGQYITPQAMGQLCSHTKLPKGFANFCHDHESPLVRNLVIDNLETLSAVSDKTVMLRTVDGIHHGVVTDSFKRMDTSLIAGVFAGEFSKLNMLPVACEMSATRIYVKALLPRIYGAEWNEALCFGLTLETSDFGFAKVKADPFCQRVFCSNRAQMSVGLGKGLSKTHRGARLTEETFQLSAQTQELQALAMASEFRDALRSFMSPESINLYTTAIGRCFAESSARQLSGKGYDVCAEIDKLRSARKLTEKQATYVADVYASKDRDVVPQVADGRWRLAQAIAYAAQHFSDKMDPDSQSELEWLAGEIVESAPAGALLAAAN